MVVLRSTFAGSGKAIRDRAPDAAAGVGGERSAMERIEPIDRFEKAPISQLHEIRPIEAISRPSMEFRQCKSAREGLIVLKEAFAARRFVFKPQPAPQRGF